MGVVFRNAYTLVLHKQGARLYMMLKEVINSHLITEVSSKRIFTCTKCTCSWWINRLNNRYIVLHVHVSFHDCLMVFIAVLVIITQNIKIMILKNLICLNKQKTQDIHVPISNCT